MKLPLFEGTFISRATNNVTIIPLFVEEGQILQSFVLFQSYNDRYNTCKDFPNPCLFTAI